jgi:hypothetical protein
MPRAHGRGCSPPTSWCASGAASPGAHGLGEHTLGCAHALKKGCSRRRHALTRGVNGVPHGGEHLAPHKDPGAGGEEQQEQPLVPDEFMSWEARRDWALIEGASHVPGSPPLWMERAVVGRQQWQCRAVSLPARCLLAAAACRASLDAPRQLAQPAVPGRSSGCLKQAFFLPPIPPAPT